MSANLATEGARDEQIARVRSFNRLWTSTIGVLNAGLLDSPYSLTEARVIFELAQADATEQAALRRGLELDAGYLTRIVARFKTDELILSESSSEDGRRQVIRLTPAGRSVFRMLDERSAAQVAQLLRGFSDEEVARLVGAMDSISSALRARRPGRPFEIRSLQPGDLGWVVQRHGEVYAEEYGWDETFEGLVAGIVADYVRDRDQTREDAWIAELDGQRAGCVFCVRKDDATAQLRILLVEPSARGVGIGNGLVVQCIRFARRAGYERLVLWTNDVLVSARRIYEANGFRLVSEEPHHSFGRDLVGQYWELDLTGSAQHVIAITDRE